jgi:uncharacterized membrane protein YccC
VSGINELRVFSTGLDLTVFEAGTRSETVLILARRNGRLNRGRGRLTLNRIGWPVVLHSGRTAVVAVVALLVAQLFRLPSSYWAPITALVVTQSSLGAALVVSSQRFIGTVLGAVVGAFAATFFPPNVVVFGICIFLLGLLCALTRADYSAYRFGGITVAIVFLIPRTGPVWQVAFHRFSEVSVGLGVALLFAWAWPEKEAKRAR